MIKTFHTQTKPTKDNTFCFFPFFALVCKMYNGNDLERVAPCCMMHDTKKNSILEPEEIQGLTPEEIFFHPKFDELRENMINGVRHPKCETCWNFEDQNIPSPRLYGQWPFNDNEVKLREIDLTLSNKCNLACRMCNSGSSHQILKDINALKKINKFFEFQDASAGTNEPHGALEGHTINLNTEEENKELGWIYNNTDKIKILKASGGEPFYDKKLINLLDKFISDGVSKDVELVFHTNMTLIDDEMIERLNQFKSQRHTFSIDGVGKIYNYIRHYSDFEIIDNNFTNWLKNSTNINIINLNLVLSALNLGNVWDFLEWFRTKIQYTYPAQIFISPVRPYGRGIDIKNLPLHYLEKYYHHLTNYTELLEGINGQNKILNAIHGKQKYKSLILEIDKLLIWIDQAIEENNYKYGKENLKKEIVLLDKVRNQSYRDYLNEDLVQILDKIEI